MDLLRTITAERDDLAVQVADLIRERDEMTDLLADTRGRNSQDWQTMIAQVNDVTRQRDELLEMVRTPTVPITNEPYLGLATTESLFQELITRFKLEWMSSDTSVLSNVDRCIGLAVMLGGLSAPEREYRTVEHG